MYHPGDTKHGLATRAILARARVQDMGDNDGECSSFQWLVHYPLDRLLILSRPNGGKVLPTTENANFVSPTRRHPVAYERASRASGTLNQDLKVLQIIDGDYLFVARDKKTLSDAHENDKARVGFGTKFRNGRMHLVGSEECLAGFELLEDLMFRNGIEPFMKKLPDRSRNVDMCMRVLKADPRDIGKRENEDHFYPSELQRGNRSHHRFHDQKEGGDNG